MIQVVLVGIGGGIAAALLFLAPIGGTPLAFPLFLLTGLPLGIVGLGWGLVASGIAVLAAAGIVFVAVTGIAAVVFLLLFGAPVLWLSRFTLLSRPTDQTAAQGPREWYPLGRLLLHAAAAATVGLVLAGALIGFNPQTLTREITAALTELLTSMQQTGTRPTPVDVAPYVRFNVAVIPVTIGALMVFVLVFDLWLAAIIARASGRLTRPAQPLWTAALPNQALLALAAGVVMVILLRGSLEEVGKVLVGTFGGAAALIGLAVLHARTRGMSGRTPLLWVTYLLVVLPGLPLVLFTILGVADGFLHLRGRQVAAPPPD